MKRTWWIGACTVVVVVALSAGVAVAQTGGTPTDTPSFLDRIAQKLGIETPKLKDAITSARNDEIDAAVARGDLTQKQADTLKQKSANFPDRGPFEFRHGGPKGPFGIGPGFGFGFGLKAGFGDLAQFLGISTDQLQTELRADGATLATVAHAHGKSRDELKAFLSDAAKTKLNDAVKNGDLTQKVADGIASRLNDQLDALIDGKFPGRGHFKFGFKPKLMPGAAPGSDQPQQRQTAPPPAESF